MIFLPFLPDEGEGEILIGVDNLFSLKIFCDFIV